MSHAAKSVELDPLDLMTNYRLMQANYYARRYDEAVLTGRVAVELTPDSPYTCFYLALSLAAAGLKHEAWDIAITGKKLNEGLPLGEGFLGYLAGVLGQTSEARGVLRDLQNRREKGYIPALPLAWTYLGLSEPDAALACLQIALAEHEPHLESLIVFPAYDSIREQATFRRMVQQLKFPT